MSETEPFASNLRTEIYAQAVALFLVPHMGEPQANAHVLKNLAAVLTGLRAGERADKMAMTLLASCTQGSVDKVA